MRKLIIILIHLFLINSAIGQRDLEDAPFKSYSKWSAGFGVKSSFEDITTYKALQTNYQFGYDPKFSLEIEFFGERRLLNNWYLLIGINYHHLSLEYDYEVPVTFDHSFPPNQDGVVINNYPLDLDNSFERIQLVAETEFFTYEDGNDYEDGDSLNFRISSVNKLSFIGIPMQMKSRIM